MKKITFLLLTFVFMFGSLGCSQTQTQETQKEKQSENQSESPKTAEVTTAKSSLSAGTYKGISTTSGCEFNFEIQVVGETVKGTGVGTGKDIKCEIALNGTADDSGNMIGQATGTYSASSQGIKIDWYLSGKFYIINDPEEASDNNLVINLDGTGNTCPANIPCDNEGDNILAIIRKG